MEASGSVLEEDVSMVSDKSLPTKRCAHRSCLATNKNITGQWNCLAFAFRARSDYFQERSANVFYLMELPSRETAELGIRI